MRKFHIAAAFAVSIAAIPAAASTGVSAPQVGVSVGDLDLTDPADRDRLERRIDRATRKVCATGMRGLTARQHELACRKVALAAVEDEKRIAFAKAHRERLRLARAASRTAPSTY